MSLSEDFVLDPSYCIHAPFYFRMARAGLKLTLAQVALDTGLNLGHLSQLERGLYSSTRANLSHIELLFTYYIQKNIHFGPGPSISFSFNNLKKSLTSTPDEEKDISSCPAFLETFSE